jgi:hypothetical protein
MKYYVSAGRGGFFFRIGMVVTGMMGSLVYWRASRRRGAAQSIELFRPRVILSLAVGGREIDSQIRSAC